MPRQIPIDNVTPTSGSPGSFTVGIMAPDNTTGDWTAVFQGKFFRLKISPFSTLPWYTTGSDTVLPPGGYQLIRATQFDVIENESYAGRYTTYTPVNGGDVASSTFSAGSTEIRVSENVPAPISPGDATTGFITNVTTYYIMRLDGEPAFVVPPEVTVETNGLEYTGRYLTGYGEVLLQNQANLLQNFASAVAPADPTTGMLWYDTSTNLLMFWDGSWQVVNQSAFAPIQSYRHTQVAVDTTWSISHNLGALSPFIVHTSFFIDVGGGTLDFAVPDSMSYVNSNLVVATFATPQSGYVLVRL